MYDELMEERIVNKVGGRFKLSTLIQKRMVALNRGARPLVELPTKDAMDSRPGSINAFAYPLPSTPLLSRVRQQ